MTCATTRICSPTDARTDARQNHPQTLLAALWVPLLLPVSACQRLSVAACQPVPGTPFVPVRTVRTVLVLFVPAGSLWGRPTALSVPAGAPLDRPRPLPPALLPSLPFASSRPAAPHSSWSFLSIRGHVLDIVVSFDVGTCNSGSGDG